MKKILLTCTDLMAVQFFLEHITFWTENRFAVDIVCSPVGGRVDELKNKLSTLENISVQTVKLRRSPFKPSNIVGYRQMKALLKKEEYDCIITNEPVMGLVTRLAAKKKKSRVIYITHGFHFYRGGAKIKNFIYRLLEKIAARHTDILVTINQEDFAAAKKFRLRKNGKAEYIPGIGVNLNRFVPLDTIARSEKRKELNIQPNEVAIVAVGELNKNKNQKIFIECLGKLRQENVKLFLVGKGDQRTKLEKLVKKLHLEDKVIFTGYLHNLPGMLSAFDIGVSASKREGLGLNLIEEMACGLPIIASANRGHCDIVEEGCGYLFDFKNAQEIVTTMQLLIDDVKLRYNIGQFNIQSCRRFAIEKVKPMLLEIINENV